MLFNSLTFLYFFVAVVVVLRLLPPKGIARNVWVLTASFLFYASWSPPFILLLLATALVDYAVARKMGSLPTKEARRPWLIGSMIFSLGSLGFFKYTGMAMSTAGSLASLLGAAWKPPALDIVLPLGISFYTFETISYGVDVYRGALTPKKSFFEYLSFLMFFPKLIAGPIVRASELLYQIPRPRLIEEERFGEGITLIGHGFLKKVIFADNFAPFVEQVFAQPLAHNRWMNIVAVYGYSMQVYFDFSAYSDIARGCAKILGYDLPLNFNQPYKAVSMSDFWRRWHMTLSRWLRDYLYIPLGGNKGSKLATYRNLFLTMLLGGLWHGANWTFVAWGALNGIFLLVERAYFEIRGVKQKKISEMGTMERLLRGLVVFHLITFTRIFFRAPDFGIAIDVIHAILAPKTTEVVPSFALFAIPAATIAYVALSQYKERVLAIRPRGARVFVYAAAGVALLCFGASQAEFIYFQF
jgi:D-alanyl-lipoteichoic acid acyltransferase DltB (MBOAT superfamily)